MKKRIILFLFLFPLFGISQEDGGPTHIVPEEIRSVNWFEQFDGDCYSSIRGESMRIVEVDSLKYGIVYFGAQLHDVLGYFLFDPNDSSNNTCWKVKYGEETVLDAPIVFDEGFVTFNYRKFDPMDCL